MPTIYAHYNFGQLTVPHLPPEQRSVIEAHRDSYDVGLQGPDFLFYYLLYKSKEPVRFGQDLHQLTFAEILETMVRGRTEAAEREGRVLSSRRDAFKPAELAYLYGFAGHHTLDAAAHPFVHAEAGDDTALHFAIETDFDEAILKDQGIEPWTYNLKQCLPAGSEVQEAVATVYSMWHDRVSPKELKRSVRAMRFIRNVMYTPTERRAGLLRAGMQKLGFWDPYGTMLMLPDKGSPERVSQDRTAELFRCYEQAIADYPQVMQDVDRVIEGEEPSPLLLRDFN